MAMRPDTRTNLITATSVVLAIIVSVAGLMIPQMNSIKDRLDAVEKSNVALGVKIDGVISELTKVGTNAAVARDRTEAHEKP